MLLWAGLTFICRKYRDANSKCSLYIFCYWITARL